MAISRLIARPLLGSIFFYAGFNAVKDPEPMKEKARKVTDLVSPIARQRGIPVPTDPALAVRLNGAAQVAAAAALATGRAPRLSAAVLAGSLVPTTYAGHAFWDETDPAARGMQKVQFAKNLSLLGGLLLAALDTEGKPGVAWRVQHGAKAAKREAKRLAHEARLEARLAAKSL